MASRKKSAHASKQGQGASKGDRKKSGGSALFIQLGALAVVIGLVVYLLVTGFINDDESPSAISNGANGQAASARPAEGDELPSAPVTIDPPFIHFGEVAPNTIHRREVTLTNTGSSPVRILDTRPSCPCTKVERHAGTIQPGRSIIMEVEMDSEARIGPKSVQVNVMFAGYDRMRIPINATVVDGPA